MRVSRLCIGLAAGALIALPAAPATAGPAQARAFGAVQTKAQFRVQVDGKLKAKGVAFKKATKRFGLRAGLHTVTVRNARGVRLARTRFAVRADERVTFAIIGTAGRPAITAVREAKAPNTAEGLRHPWMRFANLVPGLTADLRLAAPSLSLVRNLRFARTSKLVGMPRSAGVYGDPSRVVLRRAGSSDNLQIQSFPFVVGAGMTLVAVPAGKGAELRALPG